MLKDFLFIEYNYDRQFISELTRRTSAIGRRAPFPNDGRSSSSAQRIDVERRFTLQQPTANLRLIQVAAAAGLHHLGRPTARDGDHSIRIADHQVARMDD